MWYVCQWLKVHGLRGNRHELSKEKWSMRTQETSHEESHVAQGTFARMNMERGYGYRQEIGSVLAGKARSEA